MQKEVVGLKHCSYEILLEDGLLHKAGACVKSAGLSGKVALISDSNVAPLYGEVLVGSLRGGGYEVFSYTVPAGEASKSMEQAESLCRQMAEDGHERSSFVVALGGGVVGDLAGFVAAIYYRGIPFVQVPTTIVAQVDSAVGGKTGVNLPQGKNLLGAFHQPSLVIVDPLTLRSLPLREYQEGFAEVIKHAAIRDRDMLQELREISPESPPPPAGILLRNIAIKARIVEEDERETSGMRALLNFGHTIGHAIEASVPYGELLHGEAVALGMKAALFLSRKYGGLSQQDSDCVSALIAHFGLPECMPAKIMSAELIEKMARDKKFLGGKRKFVLLSEAGKAFVCGEVTDEDVILAIEELR